MKCGKILKYSLLVLGLLVSQFLYSLSPEEKELLPEQTKPDLIKIILIYDQALNDLEISITGRERETEQRETVLNQREQELKKSEAEQIEREKLLIQHEALFLESLEIQTMIMIKTKIIYGVGGILIGGFTGYTVGHY